MKLIVLSSDGETWFDLRGAQVYLATDAHVAVCNNSGEVPPAAAVPEQTHLQLLFMEMEKILASSQEEGRG